NLPGAKPIDGRRARLRQGGSTGKAARPEGIFNHFGRTFNFPRCTDEAIAGGSAPLVFCIRDVVFGLAATSTGSRARGWLHWTNGEEARPAAAECIGAALTGRALCGRVRARHVQSYRRFPA